MNSNGFDSWALPVLSAWPKIVQIKNGVTPVPEVVEIFPTNFCNFHCPHCRFKEHHGDETSFMDIGLARRLLDELKERGVENIELSGGGEPLVHPDVNVLFDLLIQRRFRVGLITNGYEFVHSDSLREKAVECCNWIRFSVDGFTANSYRRVHGKRDIEYRELKQAITELRRLAHGTPKIGVKILVSRLNAGDALLAVQEALDAGADYLQWKFLGFPADLAVSENEATRISEQIRAQIESLGQISLSADVLPPYQGPPGSDKCLMTFLHPVIDWDGEVYICAFFEHRKERHSLGNIGANGFFGVWESQNHWAVFDRVDSRECVSNCPMRRYNPLVDLAVREDYRRGFI